MAIPIAPRPSISGKRTVIASTGGMQRVNCQYEGREMCLNLMATCKRGRKKTARHGVRRCPKTPSTDAWPATSEHRSGAPSSRQSCPSRPSPSQCGGALQSRVAAEPHTDARRSRAIRTGRRSPTVSTSMCERDAEKSSATTLQNSSPSRLHIKSPSCKKVAHNIAQSGGALP